MEKKEDTKICFPPRDDDEFQELLQSLEQRRDGDGVRLVKYDGFWFPRIYFRGTLSARELFIAQDTDTILASLPKSGTTWLKALVFSIANRNVYTTDQSPLLTSSPHMLVPFLEMDLYHRQENPILKSLSSPRIIATHVPLQILPESIHESDCKIIYICRNPLDQFISYRHFSLENRFRNNTATLELDDAFDMLCEGVHSYGPFWDHVLGYWNAHVENPEKVLFLKYEDLKEDITFGVKKIGAFMGRPFSVEEERRGVVEEIARLCSIEKLKNLEANKNGHRPGPAKLKYSSFFRKGEFGDWANYLTPAMAERFKKLMESKFEGSGLMLKIQN